MRRESIPVCATVCLLAITGCGQSQVDQKPDADKKLEEVHRGAEQVKDSAGDMAKGFEAMAKGLQHKR